MNKWRITPIPLLNTRIAKENPFDSLSGQLVNLGERSWRKHIEPKTVKRKPIKWFFRKQEIMRNFTVLNRR